MNTYMTARGITVGFLPITALIERLYAAHRPPAPPTYTVTTATGIVERHAHDATTLETEADKAAWAEYQRQCAEHDRKLEEAFVKLICLHGLKVDPPANDDWAEEQEYLGISVPLDARERKLHWLTTEVLAGPEDMLACIKGVVEASGLPEEALAQAESTFRGAMGSNSAGATPAAPNGHELADQLTL